MTSQADRLADALADRYRIERELGAGGMATVFLAHDLKHGRKVALKVLKPELAAVLGAERFVVEIRTTASLQHPHILPLFDSGEAGGFLYYVMPFIDGETLRDRLNRETQLGVDEAIRITTDIADALDYAHRQGVVHRDIKPENILLANGRPMVADFGIALAVSAAAGGRMTETGLSLGTPHYMSPEQATAEKEITGRSDIYSLASVLYEMLAGEPPHMGNSAQQIIMKIIADTPRRVTELRRTVPSHVADAVAQALEKLPADRFPTAAAFAAALGGDGAVAVAHRAAVRATPAHGGPWRTVAIGALAGMAILAATTAWAVLGRPAPAADGPVAFAFRPPLPPTQRPYVSISPDGRQVAQVVVDSAGEYVIALRELASTDVRLVAGTRGAQDPEFSPDGTQLLFEMQGTLYRTPVQGGTATLVVDSAINGGWWNDDDTVVFGRPGRGLWRVPASGGTPQQLTRLDSARREFNHWAPQGLPGGRAAIYASYASPVARARIEAVEYATGKVSVLVENAVFARYASSGHLLFVRDGAVFAAPMDESALRLTGAPVPLLEDVAAVATDGTAALAVSRTGTLATMRGAEWRMERRVLWSDRAGRTDTLPIPAGSWAEPRLSPDGRLVALTRLLPTYQVMLFDRLRGVLSALTDADVVSFNAQWMPDGRSLLLTRETPVYDLFRRSVTGTSLDTVRVSDLDKQALAVTRDGQRLAYVEAGDRDRLYVAPVSGGPAVPIEARGGNQRGADFSPDGRWIAYAEAPPAGTYDVFVRRLDGSGERLQLSADGGSQPRFTRNGREVVYRRGGDVLAVAFDPATGEAGTPQRLFSIPDAGRLNGSRTAGYDVTPDGERFLLVAPVQRPEALPTVVITRWTEELLRKVPR
jgi:serine/threonine-protein kinase